LLIEEPSGSKPPEIYKFCFAQARPQ